MPCIGRRRTLDKQRHRPAGRAKQDPRVWVRAAGSLRSARASARRVAMPTACAVVGACTSTSTADERRSRGGDRQRSRAARLNDLAAEIARKRPAPSRATSCQSMLVEQRLAKLLVRAAGTASSVATTTATSAGSTQLERSHRANAVARSCRAVWIVPLEKSLQSVGLTCRARGTARSSRRACSGATASRPLARCRRRRRPSTAVAGSSPLAAAACVEQRRDLVPVDVLERRCRPVGSLISVARFGSMRLPRVSASRNRMCSRTSAFSSRCRRRRAPSTPRPAPSPGCPSRRCSAPAAGASRRRPSMPAAPRRTSRSARSAGRARGRRGCRAAPRPARRPGRGLPPRRASATASRTPRRGSGPTRSTGP